MNFAISNIFNLNLARVLFRSLRYRNYRLYFWGQSISLMGTWIQNIALGWLVYRLTGSAAYLGIIAFASHAPSLIFTPVAGVYADRFNRRLTLIITQALSMITAIALALFVLLDIATITHLMVFAVISGVINAFDNPFRHAFVLEIIDKREDLPNAIALNSSLFNTARFIGPLIGGLLIALVGEGWCFMLNGLSFSAVIVGLIKISVKPVQRERKKESILRQLSDGLSYSWKNRPVRYLLLVVATFGFFGLPFQALMPAFAGDVLQGGATLLGTLTGSLGAGALTGALFLASRQQMNKLPLYIIICAVVFSLSQMAFSNSTIVLLSMAMLFCTGFGMIVMFNATNTLLQAISDEDKRGRVISFYSLSFMGLAPLGNLAAGAIAEFIGVKITVLAGASICLLVAFYFRNKIFGVKELL
jgi:MFS family permease